MRLRAGKKCSLLAAQLGRIRGGQHVRRIVVFELAQIDAVISAIDHQIDLRALAAPLRYMCGDCRDAQLLLDVLDVLDAQGLERVAGPGPKALRVGLPLPVAFHVVDFIFPPADPFQVEQREFIAEQIDALLLLVAELRQKRDEARLEQLGQDVAESAAAAQLGFRKQLLAAQAVVAARKRFDHRQMLRIVAEQRAEPLVKFSAQRRIPLEVPALDELICRGAGLHPRQVRGDASHGHVELHELLRGQHHALVREKQPGFIESEGQQPYLLCEPAVQTSLVVQHFLDHPGCGRAAYDDDQARLAGKIAVPGMINDPGPPQIASNGTPATASRQGK